MGFALGAFASLDQQLEEACFAQFAEVVTIQKPNTAPLVVQAIADRNAQSYSPYEGEVVEPIIRFTFRYSQSQTLPKHTLIGMGDISQFAGDVAQFWQYAIDRLDPTKSLMRGHSEDDGTTISYLARTI